MNWQAFYIQKSTNMELCLLFIREKHSPTEVGHGSYVQLLIVSNTVMHFTHMIRMYSICLSELCMHKQINQADHQRTLYT